MEEKIALEILLRYFREGSYLNLTLNHYLSEELTREQKKTITRIVYGTMQTRLYLEYQLSFFVKKAKPLEKTILLIGLYEHYAMHKPDYAIVNTLVDLAKEKDQYKARFVNSVLRHAFAKEMPVTGNEEEKLAILTSHPLWLVRMFTAQYGLEVTKRIFAADNEVPLKSARVNTLKISREQLLAAYPLFKKGYLSADGVIYEGGSIAHSEAFKKGLVTIQDESSQLVARLLAPEPHQHVLDMCAAPGSKTTHLSALMDNTGTIDAYDLYPHKEKLIKDNAARLGARNIITHTGDSTKLSEKLEDKYDAILLDAPCSGLGVLARKPEIRYHDSRAMDEIIPVQAILLENAYYLLKNGGTIVYSTCTLNKKENEKQVQKFIKAHPDMEVLKERTILPYQYHSDGFYMCLMRKSNEIDL